MIIPKVKCEPGSYGDWTIEHFEIEDDVSTRLFNLRNGGRCLVPGNYTRLKRGNTVVMSDTDAEKRDVWNICRRAEGHVLIHGLGLGMVANAIASKPNVRSVTVLEISEDLINLAKSNIELNVKIRIRHGDALTHVWPAHTFFHVVFHDIWDAICADNLKDMATLHRRWGRRCHYQESWCRNECQRLKKKGYQGGWR